MELLIERISADGGSVGGGGVKGRGLEALGGLGGGSGGLGARGVARAAVLGHFWLHLFGEVLGMDIGDVEESVFADAEVDESRLDGRFNICHAAFVNVADVGFGGGALHVKFFKRAFADDGDTDFFPFHNVEEHVAASEDAVFDGELVEGIIDFDVFGEGGKSFGIGCGRGLEHGVAGGEGVGSGGDGLRGEWDEIVHGNGLNGL